MGLVRWGEGKSRTIELIMSGNLLKGGHNNITEQGTQTDVIHSSDHLTKGELVPLLVENDAKDFVAIRLWEKPYKKSNQNRKGPIGPFSCEG